MSGDRETRTFVWPFAAIVVLAPVLLVAAMTLTLRDDPFGIFDLRYIILVVFGLPGLALLTTFILAVLLSPSRKVPILTALWVGFVGFLHFWVWVQFSAGV